MDLTKGSCKHSKSGSAQPISNSSFQNQNSIRIFVRETDYLVSRSLTVACPNEVKCSWVGSINLKKGFRAKYNTITYVGRNISQTAILHATFALSRQPLSLHKISDLIFYGRQIYTSALSLCVFKATRNQNRRETRSIAN